MQTLDVSSQPGADEVTKVSFSPDEAKLATDAARADAKAPKDDAGNPIQKTPEVTPKERPKWLPEKFKSEEDLAKAYSELEKKLGQPKEAPKGDPKVDPKTEAVDEANKVVEQAGLNMDELQKEFVENGESLTDDSYQKLEKAGIPKATVERYIEGQKALQALTLQTMLNDTVGGTEKYNEMATWAKDNMPKADLELYNRAVESNDGDKQRMALKTLRSAYENAVGSEPMLERAGSQSGVNAGEVFESRAQMVAAIKDPRYKKDPAYRAHFDAKLNRSDI